MSTVTIHAITPQLARELRLSGVWQEACPVPLERLSLVTVPYVDFSGDEHQDGEIVVLDVVAEKVAELFLSLAQQGFPIARIRSVHHYGGNDELSMQDNNTSCFCFRPIEGTDLTSLHSYGLAIDINPLQNPFVMFDEEAGTAGIHPPGGWQFLNRANQKPGMVEPIRDLVAAHGFFVWGGSWTTPIDYHHFQPQRGIAELLLALSPEDARRFLEAAIEEREKLRTLTSFPSGDGLIPLLETYRADRQRLFNSWKLFLD